MGVDERVCVCVAVRSDQGWPGAGRKASEVKRRRGGRVRTSGRGWVWEWIDSRRTRKKRRNFCKSHEQSSGLMYLLTGRAGQGSAGLGPRKDFWPFLGVGMASLDRPPRVEWRLIAK